MDASAEQTVIDRDTANLCLSPLPNGHALVALLALSLRQQFRGWRPIVLAVLFLLPGGLALLSAGTMSLRGLSLCERLEQAFVYTLIPGALAPLAALLCAGGIVRDDIEEQTLTYLLLRPIPRPLLYVIKLLAAFIAVTLLTVFFSVATLFFIEWLTGQAASSMSSIPITKLAAVFTLAQFAYCGLFGILGMVMRRSLIVGVAYIVLFEWALAAFDTLIRRATVMFHFRVLVLRWLQPAYKKQWGIDLAQAPTATECVLFLLIAGVVLAGLGAAIFAMREFRMKTPEGE